MKLRTILLITFLISLFEVRAQELTVKSMTAVPVDLSASQYERKDNKGKSCGLVKVQLATTGAQFKGKVIGETEYKTNEYWVYMSEGAYNLSIKLPDYALLEVNFRDYGINEVIGKATYKLTLLMPQTDEAMYGDLDVNYMPIGSEVYIDNKKAGVSPRVFRNLRAGRYDIEIRKDQYTSKREQVTIAGGQTVELTGSLSLSSAGDVETIIVNGVSFNMIRVDGGTFKMGDDSNEAYSWEKPVHEVTLSSYYIGETEVTQELWEAVMGSNPSKFKGEQLPVERVNWYKCQHFIEKLDSLTGRKFRLPTEAEWEFAARGGTKSCGYKYSGSNNVEDVAWCSPYAKSKTHAVKTKMPNELGLYDMSGNVWEWCQDFYGKYESESQTNPKGPEKGDPLIYSEHVYRGGVWNGGSRVCRLTNRDYIGSDDQYGCYGFRLAF